jgi:PKD repeat protein
VGTKRLIALAAVLLFAGCSLDKQAAPPLVGPSELGLSVDVSATPDILTQDGQSQSTIQIFARDASSVPVSGLSLRADVYANGQQTDFGTISSKTVSTGSDGKATMIYRAPKAPSPVDPDSTLITIVVTPVGTNYAGSTIRQAELLLVRPGVIVSPGSAPVAAFSLSPSDPKEADDVFFDASASTGNIVSYSWTFGDGSSDTSASSSVRHAFDRAGSYLVTLRVKDQFGRENVASKNVTVGTAVALTADFAFSPTNPKAGGVVNFNANASKASVDRRIVDYTWDFGDGTQIFSTSSATVGHAYAGACCADVTYTATLTVTDDIGRRATVSKTITVGKP